MLKDNRVIFFANCLSLPLYGHMAMVKPYAIKGCCIEQASE